ncbi:MAG: DUF6273 domain-containing protein [Firmicutes bacterium]|nr:DUF6273 domain-containing protein [Bacillota bacterium]
MTNNQLYTFITLQEGSNGVEFGRYPQGENGEILPIAWRVLETNRKREMLILSEKVLDIAPYHNRYVATDWADSDIRKLLNGYHSNTRSIFDDSVMYEDKTSFYAKAFSVKERSKIILSPTQRNGSYNGRNFSYNKTESKDTSDWVFLLSVREVGKYFGQGSVKTCDGEFVGFLTTPLDGAIAQRTEYAYKKRIDNGKASKVFMEALIPEKESSWWLRNRGSHSHKSAVYVGADGIVHTCGNHVTYDTIGVRPALWLKLDGGQN